MRTWLKICQMFCVVIFSGILLTGCGSTNAENASLASKPLQSSHARIKISRVESIISAGSSARVKVDGREIASLGSGGSTMLDLPSGSHKIVVDDPLYPNSYSITLEAKSSTQYMLEIAPRGEVNAAVAVFGVAGMLAESAMNENGGVFQVRVVDAKPVAM